jgi:hypothetical protein
VKLRGGSDPGGAVEGVSRWSSAKTWTGAQVTLAASHSLPVEGAHWVGDVKSSVPSTITGPPAVSATSEIGLPGAPDAGNVTCSR